MSVSRNCWSSSRWLHSSCGSLDARETERTQLPLSARWAAHDRPGLLRHAVAVDKADQIRERLATTARFAESLVGLFADDAAAQAKEAGFVSEVLRPGSPPVTADMRSNRIRLRVDAGDRVVSAAAG